eukprot:gene26841-biopygen17430
MKPLIAFDFVPPQQMIPNHNWIPQQHWTP